MKVVHLSTSCRGGAGIAAMRHHVSLLNAGVDSRFVTRDHAGGIKNTYSLDDVYPAKARMHTRLRIYAQRIGFTDSTNAFLSAKYLKNRDSTLEYFSFPFSNFFVEDLKLVKEADVVHLHWIADDFLNTPTFFRSVKDKPVVWTLHDMNPFTGGCHHSDGHKGFMQTCTNCPQLPPEHSSKVAAEMLHKKRKAYSHIRDLYIVTPSQWLKSLSEKSAAFSGRKHLSIPNRVDESVFKPTDKGEARRTLGLPEDKKIVLFVSHNVDHQRKGIANLLRAVALLNNDIVLCSVGSKRNNEGNGFDLGYIKDDKVMAMAYSAADLFALPSYAENYPNTIAESLLCGTPVVACRVGGIPEQVGNDEGILANPADIAGIAEAINSVLNSKGRFNSELIRSNAIQKFSFGNTTAQYISLYNNISAQDDFSNNC